MLQIVKHPTELNAQLWTGKYAINLLGTKYEAIWRFEQSITDFHYAYTKICRWQVEMLHRFIFSSNVS